MSDVGHDLDRAYCDRIIFKLLTLFTIMFAAGILFGYWILR
jgi:Sec-independent protein secretion pathway component TatC